MRCKLMYLTDAFGNPLTNFIDFKVNETCALIIRFDKHPKLGAPKPDVMTRTSAIRLINFQCGYFITQNSIYDFGGA